MFMRVHGAPTYFYSSWTKISIRHAVSRGVFFLNHRSMPYVAVLSPDTVEPVPSHPQAQSSEGLQGKHMVR